jgi:transcription elongation factor SPT6
MEEKPVMAFKDGPQFLHLLQAEEEGLIKISILVQEPQTESFAATLVRCCRSDEYGEISKEWNELREAVCWDLVRRLLLPMGAKWIKEHMRGEAEDWVAGTARHELEYVSLGDIRH